MDVRYINPFLTAVGLVFQTTAEMSVGMGSPYLKHTRKDPADVFCVAAIIELKGVTEGIVAMRFSKPVVKALVKALTGEAPPTINADCLDALGEVANMVVGNAKANFPLAGTTISTPKVSLTDPLDKPPVLVMPFESAAGKFLIEVHLSSSAKGAGRTEAEKPVAAEAAAPAENATNAPAAQTAAAAK